MLFSLIFCWVDFVKQAAGCIQTFKALGFKIKIIKQL